MGSNRSREEKKVTAVERFNQTKESGATPVVADAKVESVEKGADLDEEERSRRGTTTMLNLFARCEKLCPGKRKISSAVVCYIRRGADTTWQQIGQTEVVRETTWPNYKEALKVSSYMEEVTYVRLEVYRVRSEIDMDDLSTQSFIGCVEFRLIEALKARSKGTGPTAGWLVLNLKSHRPESAGKIALWAEEDYSSKSFVSFELSGKRLHHTDFWKRRPDAYFILYTTNRHSTKTMSRGSVRISDEPTGDEDDDDEWEDIQHVTRREVHRSETVRGTKSPGWRRCEMSVQKLCNSDSNQQIAIEVQDWYLLTKPIVIGWCYTTFDDLNTCFRRSTPLTLTLYTSSSRSNSTKVRKDKLHRDSTRWSLTSNRNSGRPLDRQQMFETKLAKGQIIFEKVGVQRTFTFLDFVRGGLILKSIFAVDLTRSNSSIHDPRSLHYMGAGGKNDYSTAIRALGDVLASYAGDGSSAGFPTYGFGARIPPTHTICSDCFSLTGDFLAPEVKDIDSAVEAYKHSVQVVHLHGPTRLQKTIETATDWARPHAAVTTEGENGVEMRYYVSVIITQGGVEDEEATVAALAEATETPLSVIIIGVGGEESRFLRDLNAEVKAHQRHRMVVPCGNGHECQQVTQSKLNKKYNKCSGCARSLVELRTRWHCSECSSDNDVDDVNLCQDCAISWAQEAAGRPVHRDIVQYISFDQYRGRPESMAAAALTRIPADVLDYYRALGVQPRGLDKFEDKNGQPIPRMHIDDQEAKPEASKRKSIHVTAKERRANLLKTKPEDETQMDEESQEKARSTVAEKRAALEAHLAKIPPRIRERRDEILTAAVRAGYENGTIERTQREGVPEASLESFVDNLVNCCHGAGGKTYKDMVEDLKPKPVTDTFSFAKEVQRMRRNSVVHDHRLSRALSMSAGRRNSKDLGDLSKDLRRLSTAIDAPTAPQVDLPLALLPGRADAEVVTGTPLPDVNLSGLRQQRRTGFFPNSEHRSQCTICMEQAIDVELRPCGHQVACEECIAKLPRPMCPLCRALVLERRKL